MVLITNYAERQKFMNEGKQEVDFLGKKDGANLEKENNVVKRTTYIRPDGNTDEVWSCESYTGHNDIPMLQGYDLKVLKVEEFPRMKIIPPGVSGNHMVWSLNYFLEKNNLTTDDVDRCKSEPMEKIGTVNNNTHYNNFVYLKDGRKMKI